MTQKMHCGLCKADYADSETIDQHNWRAHPAIMRQLTGLAAARRAPREAPSEALDAVVEEQIGNWREAASAAVFYARVAARSKGYALAVHGSLRRDIDVIATPWTDEACSADELAEHIATSLVTYGCSYDGAWLHGEKSREEKPHGRIAWSIPFKAGRFAFAESMYLDLSVAPRAASGRSEGPAGSQGEPSEAVTRFEVIDHRKGGDDGNVGRVYSAWPCTVELQYQDQGRTLKAFVTDALAGADHAK